MQLYLFGSRASEKYSPDSDVDVVIGNAFGIPFNSAEVRDFQTRFRRHALENSQKRAALDLFTHDCNGNSPFKLISVFDYGDRTIDFMEHADGEIRFGEFKNTWRLISEGELLSQLETAFNACP